MEGTQLNLNNRIIRIDDCMDKKIVLFKNQNFDTIKGACALNNNLFEDSTFPPDDASLYFHKNILCDKKVVWKRPTELCENPSFFGGELKVWNFSSGLLKNAALIFGCSSLSLNEKLFNFIVPENQDFTLSNYGGIFHFRFWYHGKWVDVCVDDRIPVDSENNFVFSHNTANTNEFWLPLCEKAYAKLCGCYEFLNDVTVREILVDLTGGFVEKFDIKNLKNEKRKKEMWQFLNESQVNRSLIHGYIEPNPKIRGTRLANGLAIDRYYVVSKLISVFDDEKNFNLIQIKNPWDQKIDWRLPWSDKVNNLVKKSDQIKTLLGQENSHGHFWITFDDFYHYFETILVCEFTNDAFFLDQNDQRWTVFSYHGEWKFNKTNIGFKQSDQEYWKNPQLFFKIDNASDEKMNVIVSLHQKYIREQLLENDCYNSEAFVQFRIYRTLDESAALEANRNCSRLYANHLDKVVSSGCYVNSGEVIRRFRLAPGNYVIIPSCYDTRKAQFLLRVGTETPVDHENSTILEEFKSTLDKEDIYFPVQNTQMSNEEKDYVITECKFYFDYSAHKDTDRMNTKKINKYFD
ncbi:calpain-A-like isoform X3 [Brachionus plicatilis]|uniref:Calpain-A-like isoform X3 n=1 Tax=Brachionus plicatilis TaxID=10195 RepID=A0A3M7PE56_BRAPC|nr:calpain-A-like isoform X3 [Brachionus plicatilis]